MGYHSYLKGFATSHPPLMVFTLCLMAFGVTMVVIAYIVREKELPNPDIQLDWNMFLKKISELKLCVPPQNTVWLQNHRNLSSFNITGKETITTIDHSKSLSALLPDIVPDKSNEEEEPYNLTISVFVPFRIHAAFYPALLTGQVTGHQLGFRGNLGEKKLQISLSLPLSRNLTDCPNCPVCLTLTGSSHLLPHTKRPLQCLNTLTEVLPLSIQNAGSICPHNSYINLKYSPDPKLTVMLSFHDRSLVNLHLMHTSYFLFVMVLSLLGYSFLRTYSRSQHIEKAMMEI